jgi:hypothetical protein
MTLAGRFLAFGSLGHGGIMARQRERATMKKPINKFAIGLWVLAAAYLIGEVWSWYYFAHMNAQLAQLDKALGKSALQLPVFLDAPPYLVLSAAVLASLGVLIEIGDKIRWLLERRPD